MKPLGHGRYITHACKFIILPEINNLHNHKQIKLGCTLFGISCHCCLEAVDVVSCKFCLSVCVIVSWRMFAWACTWEKTPPPPPQTKARTPICCQRRSGGRGGLRQAAISSRLNNLRPCSLAEPWLSHAPQLRVLPRRQRSMGQGSRQTGVWSH